MNKPSPNLYIIAGPNGAGKTTFAREFLPHFVHCKEFINADLIAGGLAPFSPETAALRAGRLLLDQIQVLAKKKSDFGFETTLAGITYLSLFRKLKAQGYKIHLFFLWVPTVEFALARIADRVHRGGHNVPEKDVRRRFKRGLENFFKSYRSLVDIWGIFDNSEEKPRLIAHEQEKALKIFDEALFKKVLKQVEDL
ncbi:MAG: zeta toxin family protein [Candidatus Omnitrophica bacterium]|nr:zeta toxin family protein [Candidatus Omnitrophota bacterium]